VVWLSKGDRRKIKANLALKQEVHPILLKAQRGARTAAQKRTWQFWIEKNAAEITRLKKLLGRNG
jgi:hypothetical protein